MASFGLYGFRPTSTVSPLMGISLSYSVVTVHVNQ